MSELILFTLLTGVGGLFFGAVIGVFVGGRSRQSEAVLLSFSAGAMIALVCFELLHEAMETGVNLILVALAVLSGAGLVTFLDYIVDKRSGHSHDFITCEDCDEEFAHDEKHEHCDLHEHAQEHERHGHVHNDADGQHAHVHGEPAHMHAHDAEQACHSEPLKQQTASCVHSESGGPDGHISEHISHGHHHKRTSHLQLFVAGIVMAAAVAIHNLPEGMSIGAIYAGAGGRANGALFVLLLGIVLHNIPEGMAISVPLFTGGMSRAKACGVAALSGVPTVFGALLGYALGDMGALGLALSLSFAAGTLLYVVFGEVLPQSINLYCSRKTAFAAIAGVAVGMLILAGHVH